MFHLYNVLRYIILRGFLNCPHHCRMLCGAGAVVMLKSLFNSHCTHATSLLPFLYTITYSSSLDDRCCGCLCLCVWFAVSHTKLNSLLHQFVTFFLTLSLPRFVYNESAIMDELLCGKIYFHHCTLFINFLVSCTLPLLCKESVSTVAQGSLTEYC
jgi:hypothetical protein